MPIKRIPSLTGGVNEVANPENLRDDQLQDSQNYEPLGDGMLHRRKEPMEYGNDVSGDSLKTVLNTIFTNSIKQISPPYYPVKRVVNADGTRVMEGDFIILVYGLTTSGYYLYMCYENTSNTWTAEKVNIENITYDVGTYLEFFVGDDKIIITDTQELTSNLPHYVKVDADGELITGRFGVPAPTNRATVEPVDTFNRNDYEDVGTRARLGDCGIFQCVYTIETEEGDESNPSPISESRNMQFFEKDAVDFNDARWISSVLISNLSIPDVSDDLTERMKYFNVYYRISRYSEGSGAQPFTFSQRFEILDKENYSGITGNRYAVTLEADLSDPNIFVSYENDVSPLAKHAAETSSIVGFGNLREKVAFPFEFQYYTVININNITNKNYVDAVVEITLYDQNQPVDNINIKENAIIDELDLTYYLGADGKLSRLNQIRIFGADMKTMYPVMYRQYSGGTVLNIYVKVPLLIAGGITYLYLTFNNSTDEPYGVDDVNYQTVEYGQFSLIDDADDWSTQVLFQSERVKDNTSVICMPNDIEDNNEEVLNRVNTLDNGKFIDEAKWVDDRVGKTLLPGTGEVGAVKALQLPTEDSIVLFDNLNLAAVTKGYYYGRIKYDSTYLAYSAMKLIALLRGAEITPGTNYVNNIGLGIDFDIPGVNIQDAVPKWFVWGGEKENPDGDSNLQAKLYFENLSDTLQPKSILDGSVDAEYFVLLSFDKDEKISLFVADLNAKSFRCEEVLWSAWENVDEDNEEINLNEILGFELGGLALSIINSIYDQWQFVNGTYLSANDLDDKTAVYNICNYMPSFDRAIGIKLL